MGMQIVRYFLTKGGGEMSSELDGLNYVRNRSGLVSEICKVTGFAEGGGELLNQTHGVRFD